MKATEKKETDVLHPFEKSYCRERSSGQDRFGKLSGNRMRKIKTESYPNDAKKKRIKNDNEKKTERKIKHVSTVSLPNYNELIKRNRKVSADMENGDDKNGNQSVGLKLPRRNSSTISLPGEGSNSILSSLSEATIHCLETYMKRCRSFGSLKPQQLLEKLEEFNKTQRSASESSDSWCGLDEWDLAVIEYCDPETSVPPPKPAPPRKQERCTFILGDDSFNMNRNRSGRESKVDSQIEQSKESPSNLDGKSEIKVLVPLEWFLDPKRRPPVILPIARESHNQKRLKAPPSSPESEGKGSTVNSPRESIKDAREHSSLLKILKQYKEDESEQEVRIDVRELVNEVLDDSQKDSMNFDEVDVEFSSKSNLNPFVSMKNRSNSFGEEKIRTSSLEGSTAARSSSLGLECSTLLLRQLQNNWEEIQREILLRPNELLNRLRRESLLRSLPKDAFEAFEKKKTTALRESLNEFLGFTDSTESAETDNKDSTKGSKEEKPNDDQERIRIEKEEEAKEKKEDEKIESHLIPESPFSLNPFKTAINSPEAEKSASNPDNLVTLKDIVGPF